MSEKRITLYGAEASPFSHRVTLALEEAKLPYDLISFELDTVPEWFDEKVYHEVPYLVYGGPKLQPGDSPSPDLPQLGESTVILEFLADTFPEAHLLPLVPFLRARARLFYRAVDEEYWLAFGSFFFKHGPKETLYDAMEHIQSLLPPAGGFAVGEWSIADAAFLPLYLQTLALLEVNPETLTPGSAAEVSATLSGSPRFARMRQYYEDSMARPSVTKTWDPISIHAKLARRFEFFKTQAPQSEPLPCPTIGTHLGKLRPFASLRRRLMRLLSV